MPAPSIMTEHHRQACARDWGGFDQAHVWHPYAAPDGAGNLPVVGAQGVHLELEDGRRLVDAMASWWCAIHGYRHPRLDAALNGQLGRMAHVMFGGLRHPGASELAALLLDLAPPGLSRVFFCDSGSVAVEVAIKQALQFWQARGQTGRRRLLALRGGYHGDTFGAMAVCDPVNGMHRLFSGVLPGHLFAPRPDCPPQRPWSPAAIEPLASLLQAHHRELAAVIVEPLVQGAGGMHFYHPEYLRTLRGLCDEYGLLLICDEIATGFGRTGELFACDAAGITPDILCLGKALTGGYLSMAATLCRESVARGIASAPPGVFMHGPTFMANPLACAVARASVELLVEDDWRARVRSIAQGLELALRPLAAHPAVAGVRVLGAIGVVELARPVDVPRMQPAFLAEGVWLRPFRNLLYTMPPYVVTPGQVAQIGRAMAAAVRALE